uniref:Uncharacterized protein n=1 Tax=Rousettus aegyptiacus TaxID=9407 RepID=A0A7J8E7W5_ROUAE|nr:hypothetical protein HJG63_008075 [Rousettus aegyptiacus]
MNVWPASLGSLCPVAEPDVSRALLSGRIGPGDAVGWGGQDGGGTISCCAGGLSPEGGGAAGEKLGAERDRQVPCLQGLQLHQSRWTLTGGTWHGLCCRTGHGVHGGPVTSMVLVTFTAPLGALLALATWQSAVFP